ncbi:MAG: hypothetical protein KJ574_02975 [Nanoarchaeota archaeon]|nr:hypothetical protein [Nanoarchaeota archaeon]
MNKLELMLVLCAVLCTSVVAAAMGSYEFTSLSDRPSRMMHGGFMSVHQEQRLGFYEDPIQRPSSSVCVTQKKDLDEDNDFNSVRSATCMNCEDYGSYGFVSRASQQNRYGPQYKFFAGRG